MSGGRDRISDPGIGVVVLFDPRTADHEEKARWFARVRSQAGVRKYGQPVGSLIEVDAPSSRFRRRRPAGTRGAIPPISDRWARGTWGYSHSGSFGATGASATLMGIRGYRYEEGLEDVAMRMLRAIADRKQITKERRFHGTTGAQWANVHVGQTVDVPLTATGKDSGTVTYAGYSDNPKTKYLIVFPPGIPGYGIGRAKDEEERDIGWDEMVVAGRFKVVARHDVAERSHTEPAYTRIELAPVGLYDPVHHRWRDYKQREQPARYEGPHADLVAELEDHSAVVRDGKVQLWLLPNRSNYDKHIRPNQWTTSEREAKLRAKWEDRPEPPSRWVPLEDAKIEWTVSTEARVTFPGDQEPVEERVH